MARGRKPERFGKNKVTVLEIHEKTAISKPMVRLYLKDPKGFTQVGDPARKEAVALMKAILNG